MADMYSRFLEIAQKKYIELIAPILEAAVKKLCAPGGKIWAYISGLVVEGVREYVYGAYKPEKPFYKRRGSRSGLADPHNVQIVIGDAMVDESRINFDGEMTNTTLAGTTYEGYGRNAHAVAGDGSMIEEQILSGTGYKFGLPTAHSYSGSFLQPRDFYQTYRAEYDSDIAWQYVLAEAGDALNNAGLEAAEYALTVLGL